MNFAKYKESAEGVSLSSGTLTTFNVGVFADFKLPSNFSIQPAVNYTGKGGQFSASDNGAKAVTKLQLYYLQVPVNAVYHVPVLVGDIYFGAGPYIAKGLSGKIKSTADDGQGNKSSATMDIKFGTGDGDEIKPMQYGADIIVGFKLKNGLLINANYDLGLSNDAPHAGTGTNKSKVFGVSVGFSI